jgi:APA family basic amino acid/polyamine antiporter
MPLLRILGVSFGLAVVIGSSIGAGILRTPGTVASLLGSGPLALLFWTLGGVYAVLGASALADLATTIPRSGGLYVFARRALGEGFGFTVGCADWFSNCASIAYGAVTVGEYTARLVPSLADHLIGLSAAVIVFFAALQLTGMRVSSRIQEVSSFIKAIAFLVLIGGLLLFAEPVTAGPAAAGTTPSVPSLIAMVLTLQLVLGAYDGWQSATYFAGEDRDPARNLPRSIIGGVLIVMVVYLLMNLVLVRVLPVDVLASSTLPVADAAKTWLGERGETVVTALAILSPLSLVSAVLLCAPRILHAMGSDGLIGGRVSFVDERGTPAVALLYSTVAALAVLTTGTFESIATVFAFFAVTSYAGAFVSLLVLRARESELARPFRSWGYPWTTAIVLAGALALLVGTIVGAPVQSAVAIAALAASYPVFRLTRRRSG